MTKAGKPGIWADILLWWILPAALTFAIVAWFFSDVNWSFVGGLDFSVIYTYRIALLQGLVNTISITSFSLLLGLALGFAFACLLYVPFAPLRWVIVSYIEILRDIPLVASAVESSLRQMDASLEDAARGLGASWVMTMRRVILPAARPGLVAGGLLAAVTAVAARHVSTKASSVRPTPSVRTQPCTSGVCT